ncbi:hypothetical protein KC332_g1604 [Hortaea werneckii]|uniref:HTH APSES-type domain-containing protein n=2 Tax=Hortaea werneckii TaxID=91943 RepID=A0A3M7IW05_HORWE|nr:hypothetical protein KC350_g12791 [Hortaea werneckii]OTA36353.1 hypothetical protein BTJ68_03461 [Hortaea werneckii EXF-2000]KAI6818168.1 hypothetical protein KC358_g10099 [Hortaea werneckii]KAI6943418.1 hypothetical protein KC341_g1523 [Hortaea werneckii]KAI6951035.1 hypothetical protein KC348_g327 [Hortaea werneckii]
MTATRPLPEDRNPLLEGERAPAHGILVERRCLGRTELKVKPGQVGTSNATKPDNLGVLDYAHLRVPLPKDLGASGIFSRGSNRKFPESYFLMRRSNDGFVSATGMFKAAFPYAQAEEEIAEKDYIKNLSDTASEEVAGNVWIHPDQALQLADEYGIRLWIAALLDPEPITHGNDPHIKSPPPYSQSKMANGSRRSRSPEKKQQPQQPPVETRASTRSRRSASVRSESPGATPQVKTPSRPKATPRKSRRGRGTLSRVDEGAAAVEAESVNGGEAGSTADENVKIEVETTTHQHPLASRTTRSARAASEEIGEDEERTKVNIELPAGNPDLPLPNDTEAMLREARRMVQEAEDLSAAGNGDSNNNNNRPSKPKRKAEEMIDEDDEVGLEGPRTAADGGPVVNKRARVEIKLRKEKIKKRAAVGITASLALGALVPTLAAVWGAWV